MTHSVKTRRIKGKFYPLSNEEWAEACKQLNPSEIKVLYYLRTLNPFGTIQSMTVTEIGKELNLHKGTVSRALKSLNLRGWIEFEIQSIANIKAVPNNSCNQATEAHAPQDIAEPPPLEKKPSNAIASEKAPNATPQGSASQHAPEETPKTPQTPKKQPAEKTDRVGENAAVAKSILDELKRMRVKLTAPMEKIVLTYPIEVVKRVFEEFKKLYPNNNFPENAGHQLIAIIKSNCVETTEEGKEVLAKEWNSFTPASQALKAIADKPNKAIASTPLVKKSEQDKWLENEKFRSFCQRRADEMPTKVVLFESWMRKHFDELLKLYKQATNETPLSEQHPASKELVTRVIHPVIAAGLKDGSLIEYDRLVNMVKVKDEKYWTHAKDYIESRGSE